VPEWVVALEMANGDPLRAAEIFERIDETWYMRWMAWREEKNRVVEKAAK